MDDRITIGRQGERIAAEHIRQLGGEVLERNWRCREGEIDLVAREAGDLVCIEVRTRRGLGHGHPLESITLEKLRRMRTVASRWRAGRPELAGRLRLDVIGIVLGRGAPPELVHLRGVGDLGAAR